MQKSDPTLSNVSNKPEFSQSSFSNLIIVCVYWYKPTKNSFANKNLAFSVCVMFNKTIHSNTTERDNPFSIPFSFWLGISWLGSFYEKNNESLLVLKKCRQGNKRRWRLWEQLDNLLSIHDGYDSLIIQDAQQCNDQELLWPLPSRVTEAVNLTLQWQSQAAEQLQRGKWWLCQYRHIYEANKVNGTSL